MYSTLVASCSRKLLGNRLSHTRRNCQQSGFFSSSTLPGEEKVCALTSRSYASQSPRFYQTVLGDQGENDPIVPRAESDQIVNAVRKKGVPVWYLVMSGEGHGISRARGWHAPCAPRGLMDVAPSSRSEP
ncbi:MAG: prolyl oligopeptidase family serine peptidase [Acidobacteria bacterium]|nr:prolyl oligopeptidase family serine peptidase [Acidobacteriota bacterium]